MMCPQCSYGCQAIRRVALNRRFCPPRKTHLYPNIACYSAPKTWENTSIMFELPFQHCTDGAITAQWLTRTTPNENRPMDPELSQKRIPFPPHIKIVIADNSKVHYILLQQRRGTQPLKEVSNISKIYARWGCRPDILSLLALHQAYFRLFSASTFRKWAKNISTP